MFIRRLAVGSLFAIAAVASHAAPLAIHDRLRADDTQALPGLNWVQARSAAITVDDLLARLGMDAGSDYGLWDARGNLLALVAAETNDRFTLGGLSDELWLAAGQYRFGALPAGSPVTQSQFAAVPTAQPMPEPGSLALAGAALFAAGAATRRQRAPR